METIRLLISQAVQFGWPIYQMDVKSAFLNGVLEEEAPRAWNTRIDNYFKKDGFEQCPYEHALYVKKKEGMIQDFKKKMTKEFEMTDLGLMRYFLGLEVRQDKSGIFVSQEAYAKGLLEKFKMTDCNPVSTPMEPGLKLSKYDGGERVDLSYYRSLVGSLRYLTCTRPDLCLSVGIISRFMEDPRYTHWKAAKRILRYVKGTISQGLHYSKSDKYKLTGYSDSDWCRDVDDRKSTAGYVFFMGNTAFTWVSKKEPIVTLSTCEAEYVAASWCVCHAIWLRNLLSKLEQGQVGATEIQVDNKSAVELAKNPVNHERSKHIDVRFHFIRDQVKEGKVELTHVASRDQVGDIFTKPLPTLLFENCKKKMGMKDGRDINV
ncbi:uncharacterized mitochondrial protein AtMg00810-like [Gastrolobium bilobum]|uniref:uncharacterized mitochondrial protein AtMg00810-like n=1 Tax=Gastrolobium bilobum TaxID=150636 RepID=UPI002AB22A46|nr:uncharacterized mitochondrial protein AtMg00810-like [Gastrolobium bilobum]